MILKVSVCVVEPPLDMSRLKSYCSIDMRFSAVNAKPHSNIHEKSHRFFHETIKGRMLCDLVSMPFASYLWWPIARWLYSTAHSCVSSCWYALRHKIFLYFTLCSESNEVLTRILKFITIFPSSFLFAESIYRQIFAITSCGILRLHSLLSTSK